MVILRNIREIECAGLIFICAIYLRCAIDSAVQETDTRELVFYFVFEDSGKYGKALVS
jgi:hypothetical protein